MLTSGVRGEVVQGINEFNLDFFLIFDTLTLEDRIWRSVDVDGVVDLWREVDLNEEGHRFEHLLYYGIEADVFR